MSQIILNDQASQVSTPAAGKTAIYTTTTSPARLMLVDENGSNYAVSPLVASSVAAVSGGYASDTYLAGSAITVPAGAWKAGTQYRCRFDMTKTGAGTAAFTVNVRMGTLGTTGDASVLSLAFAVGTAVIDSGIFEVIVTFRSVGAGTSAVVVGIVTCSHHLAATGLITTGASGFGQILGTSSGFASNTQTTIGISVNGGVSFAGTNTIVQASLVGI